MDNRIEVNVSQENIEKGKCNHTVLCPIAYALRDIGYKNVSVGQSIVYVNRFSDDAEKLAAAPGFRTEMATFVSNFDKGRKVHPLRIELVRIA